MDQALVDQIMTGQVEDLQGLRWKFDGMIWTGHAGLWLLWLRGGSDVFDRVGLLQQSAAVFEGRAP